VSIWANCWAGSQGSARRRAQVGADALRRPVRMAWVAGPSCCRIDPRQNPGRLYCRP
jgi:hypothetical protein